MLSGEGAGLFARGQGFIFRETPTPQNTQVKNMYFNYLSNPIDIIYNVYEQVATLREC